MDINEFRECGYELVDYIVDYLDSVSQRRVSPNVSEGYLASAFPSEAPEKGESFQRIMEDIEKYIMPGLTHCQHPGFHGYMPSSSSFPSILASMVHDIFNVGCLCWDYCPSGCELEVVLLNWYGKMIGLPRYFLNTGIESRGTGIMQKSTTECIFISMVTARRYTLRKLEHRNPSISSAALLSSLVAYCSTAAHSAIEKIAVVTLVNVRVLQTDKDHRLRGETLAKAMESDRKIGLIPFFVNATLGTFSCGACDPIDEIGPICEKYNVWLHVDAAYAGTAMICPEYQHFLEGIEYASSFSVTPAYWMLIHVDAAVLFVTDRYKVRDTVTVDRSVFGYSFNEKDWCKTEFHALKYMFVMRKYGVEGLQKHVRNHTRLAEMFGDFVKNDDRFVLVSRNFGIVCFRLKAEDSVNWMLNKSINATGKLFLTPTRICRKYVLRFVLCTERANEDDVIFAWKLISEETEKVLKNASDDSEYTSTEKFKEEMYQYDFS